MTGQPSTLEADGIWLQFGGRKILQNVYVKLQTGQVTGLLGRNGNGKSCLLKSILGLMPTETRSVRLNGTYVERPYQQTGLIRYLPQHAFVPPSVTVQTAMAWYGLNSQSIRAELPIIDAIKHERMGNLSGGQRRLVEVLLVLKSDVIFVLLDEPFSHLMPVQVEQLRTIIQQESQRKGILLSDHLYQHVLDLSTSIYYLNNGGRTILLGSPERDLRDLGYIR